ncbi:MAG: 2-oxo acid dehydrogenase subunit E2 [Prolixibacteraceae bacterium]|nr:2-oxo acid dehydrogenase subunit E2 [Prolixibacteraceae bacterium]
MADRKQKKGYKSIPLGFTRRMVIASVNCNKKNAIHSMTKIDITRPRKLLNEYIVKTGVKLSFTAYIVKSFSEALKAFPEMNSFIKGRRLIILDDITVSVLVERVINGVKVPEPIGIKSTQEKTVKQISDEIRLAQKNTGNELGNLTGSTWIKLIPVFLMRTFIKVADRNIKMGLRYGKVAVTAPGMYAGDATWFIPHGTATVLLTIGSMEKKNILTENGDIVKKEYLYLTASFDHEIVDGAPAARFMKHFEEILKNGKMLEDIINSTPANSNEGEV